MYSIKPTANQLRLLALEMSRLEEELPASVLESLQMHPGIITMRLPTEVRKKAEQYSELQQQWMCAA